MDEEEIIVPDDDSFFEGLGDVSANSFSLLEESFSSMPDVSSPMPPPASSSTPAKVSRKKQPKSTEQESRKQCPNCRNTYASERTLKVHLRMHALKSASIRAPKLDDLLSDSVEIIGQVLDKIIEEEVSVAMSEDLLQFCKALKGTETSDLSSYLCESFYNIYVVQNSLLPSSLRAALYRQISELLSDDKFCGEVKEILEKLVPNVSEEVRNLFLGTFVMKIFDVLLSSVFKRLHGLPDEDSVGHGKEVWDRHTQQTIYHIVGSLIHSLFVKGRRYENNDTWKIIVCVLKTKFLRNPELGNECSQFVSAFIQLRDRGGYVHCNQETFEFFLQLFQLVMSLEKEDGSFPLEAIQDCVGENDLLIFLWDKLVGAELLEEQSIDLLMRITKSCVRVIVKGVIKRRLNSELNKAYSSVSLRSRLLAR